jgi:hypothetical protein
MGQQVAAFATSPAPNKPISQAFDLWDSTRIKKTPPTCPQKNGKDHNLAFRAPPINPLKINAPLPESSPRGMAVQKLLD